MSEDKKIAREMVKREMDFLRSNPCSLPQEFVAMENQDKWPTGDGESTTIMMPIGQRGELTKRNARETAAAWREAVRRYPKAQLGISMLGYNEDPREIWQIEDAARYVRWWARYAGMDNEAAVLCAGEISMLEFRSTGCLRGVR
jgi:hypothetical protein